MNKRMIPNMLTLLRIILTPIVFILLLVKKYKIAVFIAIICALTDMLDGKLARYWHVTSLKGAKLDSIADKFFAFFVLLYLTIKYDIKFIFILLLEMVIGFINSYFHLKTKRTETLMVGKIKTTFLFVTTIVAIIALFKTKFNFLVNGFMLATVNLQILAIISYILRYIEIKGQKDNTTRIDTNLINEIIKNYHE